MKICLAQTKPVKGDIAANIEDHLNQIDLSISRASDCIFFPELSLTGYEPTMAKDLAISLDDKRLDVFQNYSDTYQIRIGVGAPVEIGAVCAIGMFLFEPAKRRRIYYKKYLHQDEKPFFESCTGALGFLDTTPRISLAICYELSVDEHLQSAREYGAKIYLASVAKFAGSIDKTWARMSHIASLQKMTTMMVNCVGLADQEICAGKTAIWRDNGKLVGQLNAKDPGLLIYDTNPKAADVF